MNRELPRTYQNKIDKKISNSRSVYSTLNKEDVVLPKNSMDKIKKDNYTVEQKIHNIFHSPDYIYKVDVTIVTENNTIKKRIVGKNRNNLITIDNEFIPISSIRDIYR